MPREIKSNKINNNRFSLNQLDKKMKVKREWEKKVEKIQDYYKNKDLEPYQ